jgi:DNA-binding transcriptional ArsR family regulator
VTESAADARWRVAAAFKALGDPLRLAIVEALRSGERNVSDLVRVTGGAQANVSKHLQILHAAGIVQRRRAGLYTCYRLADSAVGTVCDTMADRVSSAGRALESA